MAKNAVYTMRNDYNLPSDLLIKQVALLFDKVYIRKLSSHYTEEEFNKHKDSNMLCNRVYRYHVLYEYLMDKKVIVPFDDPFQDEKMFAGIDQEVFREISDNIRQTSEIDEKFEEADTIAERDDLVAAFQVAMNKRTDIMTRYKAVYLSKMHQEEFYPMLTTTASFQQAGTKTAVVQLILNNMPQPDPATPWEAIIDFRSDESTRIKYLALMNWINDISSTSLTVNEIHEKVEYLYLDYKRSFERHKLKTSVGLLEVLAAAGVGFLTSHIPTALNLVSNVLKIGSTVLNLHQEEGNLPGKEIAYIYHANRAFSS